MKTILRISFVIVLFCLFAMPVQAQSEKRVYENGSVWTITYVKTKPGHFDDYLKDLSMVWKKYLDEQIKDGKALSYKILNVAFARDDEPNLILLVEQKDWATFDTPIEYWEGVSKKVQGSLDKAEQASIDREQLRTLRGSTSAVELLFKK